MKHKTIRHIGTVLSLFFFAWLYPQGTIVFDAPFSPALNQNQNIAIYLPEGYNDNVDGSFPVLYYLHDLGENHTIINSLAPILDSLITNKQISPMIVVTPDGSAPTFGGSFWRNSVLNGNFQDYVLNDVVTFIESNFRARTTGADRAFAGQGMGGYGAVALGVENVSLFCATAGLAGYITSKIFDDLIP